MHGSLPPCNGAGDAENARNQRDLFDKRVQATEFQPDLRSKLALLLQVLLAEAAGVQRRRTETVQGGPNSGHAAE